MSERPHVDPDEPTGDRTSPGSTEESGAIPVENDEGAESLDVRFPPEEDNEHLESG